MVNRQKLELEHVQRELQLSRAEQNRAKVSFSSQQFEVEQIQGRDTALGMDPERTELFESNSKTQNGGGSSTGYGRGTARPPRGGGQVAWLNRLGRSEPRLAVVGLAALLAVAACAYAKESVGLPASLYLLWERSISSGELLPSSADPKKEAPTS
jgi:hypothetical protein